MLFLRRLIEGGADLRRRDREGNTPFLRAIAYNTRLYVAPGNEASLENNERTVVALIKLFLDAGSDVNEANKGDATALALAAMNGCNLKIVRALVEAGAKMETKSAQNPLLRVLAERYRNMDIDGLLFLMRAGGAPILRGEGATALQYAARTDCEGYYRQDGKLVFFKNAPLPSFFVERILQQNWTQKERNDALLNAAGERPLNLRFIERLIREGADVGARDEAGMTLLMRSFARGSFLTSGDIPAVSRLLELGLDINARDLNGETLLTMGSGQRMTPDILDFLLQKGANVRVKDKRGRTPLHIPHSSAAVKLLIAGGADPNAADADGNTPLHTTYDPDAVAVLIASGANVNRQNKAGKTPLLSWMERGAYLEGVQLLLEAGANAALADREGNTPLMLAMSGRKVIYSRSTANTNIANIAAATRLPPDHLLYLAFTREFLKNGADANAPRSDDKTPLIALTEKPFHLYSHGSGWRLFFDVSADIKAAFLALADYGVDVDARDNKGRTAWDYAREHEDPRVLEWLQETAKKVRYPQPSGQTPLMRAAVNKPAKALDALLEDGAALEARDSRGWTALTYAAWSNPAPDVVRLLIAQGADVDHRDAQGKTPLMRAVWHNPNAGVVRALLEGGAHPGVRDRTGNTAVDIAIAHDASTEVVALLFDATAKLTGRTPLANQMLRAVCAVTARPETVRMLLKKGAKVDDRDRYGQTALMKAVSRNPRPEIVKVLLKAGANVNAKDAKGISVLDYTLKGNPEIYEMLVAAGVDLSGKSAWWTPEEKALMQGWGNRDQEYEALMESWKRQRETP